ncbi:sensor histidine kinase [Campylobacter mucosalis]|uniref:sensor histidine kinase n=1 Tax=Campylobacter mucosalis TaxID=202 RepID=UPI001B8B5045|nr:HAMP domain-containing sensor histidine kinase [Campylobacter mucosalis]
MAIFISERNSIILKILAVYLLSTLLFFTYFFTNEYKNAKNLLISEQVKSLKEIKMGIYMKAVMNGFSAVDEFAVQKNVKICIISETNQTLYQNTSCKIPQQSVFMQDNKVGIFENIQDMQEDTTEISRSNIILTGREINGELLKIKVEIFSKIIIILISILAISYVLIRLALKPLYDKITTLNRFIKDATHEINTPLSIILMSIETMNKSELNKRNIKRIANINLAAKRLNNIYDDLLYLTFKQNTSKKELLKLDDILSQRLEYFDTIFAKQSLKIQSNIKKSEIFANRLEVVKILDNLLSNAAKYTNFGGNVSINLSKNSLSIANSGDGLNKEQLSKIFQRYVRFNKNQGGFGIGLSIVKQCCKNNNIEILCQSEPNKETTFYLKWQDKK